MNRKRAATLIVAATACLQAADARSAPGDQPRASGRGPTAAEFAALRQQVERQNELIMKLTQVEGAHYEYLLQLLSNGRPSARPPAPPPPPSPSADAWPPPQQQPSPAPPEADAGGKPRSGTITGHVDVKGKPWGPIYVYVDNIKEPAVDRGAEIVQKDRAFVPNVLVVQRGTHVSFPNADPILHNVFSPSPTQPFDLGSYKMGERPGSVRLFHPGVVEVLCNMHAKMRANVLVVPNRYHAKVGPDGNFRLENVPVGARQVVAWTPDARPTTEAVVLTATGASVKFDLQVQPAPPPVDKLGKPRSGYRQEE